jgi:hypothetical protein
VTILSGAELDGRALRVNIVTAAAVVAAAAAAAAVVAAAAAVYILVAARRGWYSALARRVEGLRENVLRYQ